MPSAALGRRRSTLWRGRCGPALHRAVNHQAQTARHAIQRLLALGYRRIGVAWLSRHMPEAGALFGGESKSALPGHTVQDLHEYYIEVSRAEWVHLGSILGACVLFLFNPWWLALGWVGFAIVANAPFLAILRHNRLRLQSILERMEIGRAHV